MLYRNQQEKLAYVTPAMPQHQIRFTLSNGPQPQNHNLYSSVQPPSYGPVMNRSVGYYQQPSLVTPTQHLKSKQLSQVAKVRVNPNNEVEESEKNTEAGHHDDNVNKEEENCSPQKWLLKHLWVILACLLIAGGVTACVIFFGKNNNQNLTNQETTQINQQENQNPVQSVSESQVQPPILINKINEKQDDEVQFINKQVKPSSTTKHPIDVVQKLQKPITNQTISESKLPKTSTSLRDQANTKIPDKLQSQINDNIKKELSLVQKQIASNLPKPAINDFKVFNSTSKSSNVPNSQGPAETVSYIKKQQSLPITKPSGKVEPQTGATVTYTLPNKINQTQVEKSVNITQKQQIPKKPQEIPQINLPKVSNNTTSVTANTTSVETGRPTNLTGKGHENSTLVTIINPVIKSATNQVAYLLNAITPLNSTQANKNASTSVTPNLEVSKAEEVEVNKIETNKEDMYIEIIRKQAEI